MAAEDEDVGAPLGGRRRPELERGRAEGRELTLDDAVALALAPGC